MEHYLTAEISRGAVAHNLEVLRARLPAGCRLCAVVKADCYGHSVEALLATIVAKADALAVATVPEALDLRERGYGGMILVTVALSPRVGGPQRDAVAEAMRREVQLTVADQADVPSLQRLAGEVAAGADIHVKIDTGMGRSGVLPAGAVQLVRAVRNAPPLRLAGVYTHFAASDEADKTHAEGQFAVFQDLLGQLGPLDGVLRHAANSAAVADMPHTALDMVRPGVAIYGYQPSDEIRYPLPLRPALRLTGPIVQIKRLPAGATVGYGCTCKLTRDSRIGIVPAGYADGIPRALAGHCPVGVDGRIAPVLGRISMDQVVIDLTDLPGVDIGHTAELISPDPQAANSVANLARLSGTIPYEVTCRLGGRITFKGVDDFRYVAGPAAAAGVEKARPTARPMPTPGVEV